MFRFPSLLMLAREECVLPCVAGILFRINAGSKLVNFQKRSDISAMACAWSGCSSLKLLRSCITVGGVAALCAVDAALLGV